MAKALVIYHANCDDGFGAAFAFWKFEAFNYESVTYHSATYGENPPSVDRDTEVFILDFSYPPETLCIFADEVKSIKVLDHHKTAKEAWDKWVDVNEYPSNLLVDFDMSRSGAMMAFDEFAIHSGGEYNECFRHFFVLLQDRDLWKFNYAATKNFTQYLRSFPQDFEIWSAICDDVCVMGPDTYSQVMAAGEGITRRYEQMCQEILSAGKREVWIDGIKGLECNCPYIFASDIGNLLAKESGTFGHTWFITASGSKHSLRSVGDFDVSALAQKFDGGGHKNAAGFHVSFNEDEMQRYYELTRKP